MVSPHNGGVNSVVETPSGIYARHAWTTIRVEEVDTACAPRRVGSAKLPVAASLSAGHRSHRSRRLVIR